MPDALRDQLQVTLGGSYTLERELGGGGMSRVFVAEETRFRRRVVLKVLAPELAQGLSAERFEREIGLAATLQEPHIVPVLSAGDVNGLPWYSMPYVAGESLRARLGRGPVPAGEAVAILRDVARALAYAHGQGVVHRDIKPENVLLHEGTAVVADFGIAKALQRARTVAPDEPAMPTQAGLTQLGTSLGTPAYMAPEQAAGDPATDHRADLYAWGVVAYELLAGRHPFAGRTSPQALLAAHMAETPAPLPPAVPRPLAALVARCLAKDPAQRPASASEVLAALDAASVAPPDPRRHLPLVGVAVATLLAVGGALAWRARSASLAPAGVASAPAAPVTTLAVLPFENVGRDTSEAYFVDGMTDELATALARAPGLTVTARASAYTFRDRRGLDTREVARRLGVGAVIDGSVQRAGGRLRTRVQLVRAADAHVLWSDAFTDDAGDVFAVQTRLARAIAQAIVPALASASGGSNTSAAAEQGTRDPAAYDLYLRARHALNLRGTHVRAAIALFDQAVARDSTFARAWAGLAGAWALLPQNDRDPVDGIAPTAAGVLVPARRAAQRALALDSLSGEAYTALGHAYTLADSLATAEPLLRRGVALDPRSATAHGWLATLYARQSRHDLREAALRRAVALEPLSGLFLSNLAGVVASAGRTEEARVLARRAVAIDPLNRSALNNAAVSLTRTGDFAEALAIFDRAAYSPREGASRRVAPLVGLGRRDSAERIVQQFRATARTADDHGQVAYLEAVLGNVDAAFAALERATGMPLDSPQWKPLARDPRFLTLCRRRLDPETCARKVQALEAFSPIPPPAAPR